MASATNTVRQKRNQYPEAWHNPASAPGVLFVQPRETSELAKNVFTELLDMRGAYTRIELRAYGLVWSWGPLDPEDVLVKKGPPPHLHLVKS